MRAIAAGQSSFQERPFLRMSTKAVPPRARIAEWPRRVSKSPSPITVPIGGSDLGARVETLEGVAFRHAPRLRDGPARLNRIPSDSFPSAVTNMRPYLQAFCADAGYSFILLENSLNLSLTRAALRLTGVKT